MTRSKRIHLVQHLKNVKSGETRVRTRDLELSLGEDEINHYICRHKASSYVKDGFDLFSEEKSNAGTLAVLHTQDGFVCLEARIPDVCVPMIGWGFNGRSAHDFRVKESKSSGMSSSLQLRPYEPFCVADLTLTLVAEEQYIEYTQLASTGVVPSYEAFSQHVSQLDAESQAPSLSTPAKTKRPHTPILETSKRSTLAKSPLARIVTSNNPRSHITKDDIAIRTEVAVQPVANEFSKRRKLSPISGVSSVGERQENEPSTPKKTKSPSLEVPSSIGNTTSSVHAKPERLTRNSSPKIDPAPVNESQDSLAGKIIKVTGGTHAAATTSEPVTSPITRPPSTHLSERTKTDLRTPSFDQSVQVSPPNSLEPSRSIRGRKSAVREESHHLQDDGLRILFSSATAIGESRVFKKFLTEQGVKMVRDIKDATCLCVGKGELKRTSKLIMAVLNGIEIIREDWVTESVKLKKLQDIGSHVARDPQREQAWGINLEEAIRRGKQGTRIFQGWTVVITQSAKKELGKANFSDYKDIATHAGADIVTTTVPKHSSEMTLIVGTPDDLALPALKDQRCYTKDIISLSVLRGNLDVESEEFLIKSEPSGKRKRKR